VIIDVAKTTNRTSYQRSKTILFWQEKKHTVKVQIFASVIGEILSVDCARGKTT
jgi:hypothetical protein